MTTGKHPFVFKYDTEFKGFPYLGSDGLPTEETYASYLGGCEEFKMKARNYAKDNLKLKNSTLSHTKYGYESSQQLEEEILLKREEHLNQYREAFDISFNGDLNFLSDSCLGKSKRVRVIRELNKKRNEEFSSDFDKKKSSWFTRYCILSRFIQAVRKVILVKRMEKALLSLRAIKSETEFKKKSQ